MTMQNIPSNILEAAALVSSYMDTRFPGDWELAGIQRRVAIKPPSAPVGVEGLSDVFNLVRACESAVRRLGWRSSDYSLGHEARMLAQGYENGAFQAARETLNALAQQPGGNKA